MTDIAHPVLSEPLRPAGPSRRVILALVAAILVALVFWLMLIGRSFICPCGVVRLWQGEMTPAENSQQISDWYSALHVIFGMGLCLLIRQYAPHWTEGRALIAATAGSAVWEAIENIPGVIALFVGSSDPLRYAGDSILNSLTDTLFVMLGFGLAYRLPVWATLLLALAAELTVSLAIGDGLVLGTLRLAGVDV